MAKLKEKPKNAEAALRGVKTTNRKTRLQEPKTIAQQSDQKIKNNSQNSSIKPAPTMCVVKNTRLRSKRSVDQIVSGSSKLVPAATVPKSTMRAIPKLTVENRPEANKQILRRCFVKLRRIKQSELVKLLSTTIKSTKSQKSNVQQARKSTIKQTNITTRATAGKQKERNTNITGIKFLSPRVRIRRQTEATTKNRNQFKENSIVQQEDEPQITLLNSLKRNKLKNLSLTGKRKKSVNKTQNDAHDITGFDPLRNSTVINFDLNTIHENDYTKLPTEQTDKLHDNLKTILENEHPHVLVTPTNDDKENTTLDELIFSQKSNTSIKSRNLTNQISKIEELLAIDIEEDDNIPKDDNIVMLNDELEIDEPLSTSFTVKAQVHKFFHTKDAIELNCNANAKEPCQSNFKNPIAPRKSHRIKVTKAKSKSRNSVFEFSQSQSTDSDTNNNKDPAADIIQRMIEEGKVTVTTRRKGAGRPVVKRIVKKYTKPAAKVTTNQRVRNATSRKDKKVPQQQLGTQKHDNVPDNNLAEVPFAMEEQESTTPQDKTLNGTFSRLARSVMLNESGKHDGDRRMLDKRQLLEVARKFVSTPLKNTKMPPPAINHTMPSPIPTAKTTTHQLTGSASPWRVPDASLIPHAFHFSRNSSNLPSFSSEYIPPTPKKNVKWASNLTNSMQSSLNLSKASPTAATTAPLISSYSSNDSNGENVPPPITDEIDTEDVNVDLQQTTSTNPRSTLSKRSPLKAINILEVVTLPPWKPAHENRDQYEDDSTNVKKLTKTSTEDAFGFDELLSSEELSSKEEEENNEKRPTKSKRTDLRRKLKQLKKWRPPDQELPQSTIVQMPKVFDDNAGKLRMHNIKEMFCSTMIKPPPAVKPIESDESDSDDENAQTDNEMQNMKVDLFNDNDPQISFNNKKPHKTYGRPVRKKRKQPHNFVLFLDSDESDEDDEHADEEDKHQKRKRPKPTEKNDIELKSFVEDFNEMCAEVDNYELIVE